VNLDKETYRRIVSAIPEGIWLVTPQGRTIFCNERMAQILGYDIKSLQRLSCFGPIYDSGRVTGLLGLFTDITDRKRAQEQDVARQKLELVGSVAGGIAHDFGNILAGIIAHCEVMLDAFAGGSIPAEAVKSIRDTAIRGADMARQLMIYMDPANEVRELVNVSVIVEDTIEILKNHYRNAWYWKLTSASSV